MPIEKKNYGEMIGKMVVTKEGKKIGFVKDISFETRTGELIQLVVREPTSFALSLNVEKEKNEILIPYNSIIAIGDFIVIAEEDIV